MVYCKIHQNGQRRTSRVARDTQSLRLRRWRCFLYVNTTKSRHNGDLAAGRRRCRLNRETLSVACESMSDLTERDQSISIPGSPTEAIRHASGFSFWRMGSVVIAVRTAGGESSGGVENSHDLRQARARRDLICIDSLRSFTKQSRP